MQGKVVDLPGLPIIAKVEVVNWGSDVMKMHN